MWASKTQSTNQHAIAAICGREAGAGLSIFRVIAQKPTPWLPKGAIALWNPMSYSLVMKMLPCLLTRIIEIA
jgi:hypothetical protein